jgi:hypothetical protein
MEARGSQTHSSSLPGPHSHDQYRRVDAFDRASCPDKVQSREIYVYASFPVRCCRSHLHLPSLPFAARGVAGQ